MPEHYTYRLDAGGLILKAPDGRDRYLQGDDEAVFFVCLGIDPSDDAIDALIAPYFEG